jgi:hypothetical protein
MRNIETAVQDLAVALDELSAKVELQKLNQSENDEVRIERNRQIDVVERKTGLAARELASIINELKKISA